jgi:hypothetical protein
MIISCGLLTSLLLDKLTVVYQSILLRPTKPNIQCISPIANQSTTGLLHGKPASAVISRDSCGASDRRYALCVHVWHISYCVLLQRYWCPLLCLYLDRDAFSLTVAVCNSLCNVRFIYEPDILLQWSCFTAYNPSSYIPFVRAYWGGFFFFWTPVMDLWSSQFLIFGMGDIMAPCSQSVRLFIAFYIFKFMDLLYILLHCLELLQKYIQMPGL